ncbi:hypothetical protein IW140_001867 [Coemansia sp. RSA 1813]|nr:hypothetical protein EV178_005047 [Coemansia sp. RSA 1646]KAJ1772391.1 hypothetical protein LPJ74_001481 [Coemansia sp. RSA 1843]KAJ2091114.1 hypothetical protein IW138_002076 [Coemansia sp. RSA 986]KAJ2212116.1 hypothetical protein EV179_004913 [Coemansia sp. RSA 487]KAJ2571164.1 hypothetical protein IW140_001867 [Coemansia sp. RSA 1813]
MAEAASRNAVNAQYSSSGATNPLAIGCPRTGCKCTIIRVGAATLVHRSSIAQPSKEDTATTSSHGMPGIGAPEAELGNLCNIPDQITALIGSSDGWYWMLTDMMDFENVGFSHSVGNVKYLSCADCDLAPLGYHDTALAKAGTKEFLIAADRVAYR